MGTRFLLTSDSPVPDAVKRLYLQAGLAGTVVTTRSTACRIVYYGREWSTG